MLYVGKDVKVKKPKKGELPQAAPARRGRGRGRGRVREPAGRLDEDLAADQLRHRRLNVQVFTLRAVSARTEVWVSNNVSFPTGDCRNDGARNVITDAQATYLLERVLGPDVPEDDRELQLAAASRRHRRDAAGAHRPAADLLPGPGEQDRHPRRELPRRELHRHHLPVVRRGLPLVRHQRLRQPQRDVDRLLRLAPPHGREPAERAVDRPLRQPAGLPFRYEGDLRARVPAPARVLGEPGRGHVGQRGPLRLRDHRHGLRLPAAHDRGVRVGRPHPDVPRLAHGGDAVQPDPAAERRRGELAHRSGRTRATSRRSPTTARRGRSWSSSTAATGRRS